MKTVLWNDDDLILSLYIQPNARQDKVENTLFNHMIKIHLCAPAIDNKANDYLIKWLAKEFEVAKSAVQIMKGQHSRQKICRIRAPTHIPIWVKNE